MSVIVVLILISLAVALVFLASFIWAVQSGQFEDTVTPALRVLSDDQAADFGSKPPENAASPQLLSSEERRTQTTSRM